VGSFLNYDGMGNVFTYVEGKGLFMYRDPSYNELDNVNLNVLSAVTSAPGNAIFNSLSFDDPRAVLGDRRNGTLTIVEPVQVRTGNIYTENGSVGTIEGGSIVTAGDVTKINAGTLILNNTNTYTGKTIVQDGTLIVNGSVAGEVVVKSGTQLGGHGTIGGLTTISSGGTLAPGNSPGTLTFTNGLTLEAGAVLEFQLGTTSDLIAVTGGTLTGPTSGLVTLNLADAGGFTAASYTLFDFSGAATSSFTASDFTLGTTISGYTYNLALVGNTLQLTATASAVPEPSTYAILAGLAALGFVAVRRRRTAAR
jgi:autotransporter-associated beta strand protein